MGSLNILFKLGKFVGQKPGGGACASASANLHRLAQSHMPNIKLIHHLEQNLRGLSRAVVCTVPKERWSDEDDDIVAKLEDGKVAAKFRTVRSHVFSYVN